MNVQRLLKTHPQQKPTPTASGENTRLAMWLSKLPGYTLSLDSHITQKILKEISDPASSTERLAALIEQDPVLCLKLYSKVMRQLKGRESNIQGLIHLIGLLGTQQIKQIIKDSPKDKTAYKGQRELLSASLFAAQLAIRLLPEKHGTRGARFFLPSLLFNAPLWLMWKAAPKLMQQGQVLASEKQQALEALSKKKLGFSLRTLLKSTSQFLSLPELTLKSLAIDLSEHKVFWCKARCINPEQLSEWIQQDKPAKHRLYSPEAGIYLINHYVLAMYLDWNGKHSQRYSTLLARHLNMTEEALHQIIIDVANTIQLPSSIKGQFTPLYRYRGMHKELSEEQANNTAAIIQQYLLQIGASHDSNTCLQLTLEALTEGIKVEHCMIFKITGERLKVPFSYGFVNQGNSQEIASLDIDFKDCGQLLKALLEKPMALSIESAQLPRINQQLPSAITQYWQPRPCGLMSLFHQGKPYAIIACDHHQWNQNKQQQFKTIGKQLLQSLKQCES